MYHMVGYENITGLTCVGGYDKVTDNFDFVCEVLDTSDNTVEQLSRAQLEQVLTNSSRIEISGIVTKNHKVATIYSPIKMAYIQKGDYTIVANTIKHNSDFFLKINVYLKGYSVPVASFDTFNLNGRSWNFYDVLIYNDFIEILLVVDGVALIYQLEKVTRKTGVSCRVTFKPDGKDFKYLDFFKDIDTVELRNVVKSWRKNNTPNNALNVGLTEMLLRAERCTLISVSYLGDAVMKKRKGTMILSRRHDLAWEYVDNSSAKSGTCGSTAFALSCLNATLMNCSDYSIVVYR